VENIAAVTLSYSIRPFADMKDAPSIQNLQGILKAIPFFRTSTGAISASEGLAAGSVSSGLSSSLSNLYLGTEVDMIVNYRPLSDLGVALQGGLFMPNSSLFVSSNVLYYVELDVSVSF